MASFLRQPLVIFLLLHACRSHTGSAPGAASSVASSRTKVNEVAVVLARGMTLDSDDASTCGNCHGAVVSEFEESLHRRAHHGSDPLYAAMRSMRTVKQGEHIPGQCASCHNPRDTTNHESKAARAGVTCATCHQLERVHLEGKKGASALEVGPSGLFRGPHELENGVSPVHATGSALPALADGRTVCLACHGEETNAQGVATCTTGPEYTVSQDMRSCASCHMPEVPGPSGAVTQRTAHRSHRFLGPHQQHRLGERGVLNDAVRVTGRFEGDAVVVTLENTSPHGFPTGFPARMALVEVRALDASGHELAKNVSGDPLKDHPEAVFNRGYVDAQGKPSLAPFAAKQVRDNRLRGAETREVRWVAPSKTARAEVRLKFFLVAPFAAKAMEYAGPETKPVSLGPFEVSR